MPLISFDDPGLQAAMRRYLEACDAVASANDEAQLLDLSDAKSVAGMQLRKQLLAAGWTAPVAQRSST